MAIANGVTFARDQAITLDFAGSTATKGADFTVSPESLTLLAGAGSAEATVTAVDDTDEEPAETVAVAAQHEGAAVGAASVTIAASDAPAEEGGSEPKGFALVANSNPAGIWSDGETLWVAEFSEKTIHAYRLSDGEREAGRDIAPAKKNLLRAGLWSDGETLWVTESFGDRVYVHALPGGESASGAEAQSAARPRAGKAGAGAGPLPRRAAILTIPDARLRAGLGAALGKEPGAAISAEEVGALRALNLRGAGVTDLTGLEPAVNLERLDLDGCALTDLAPLAGLERLERLSLRGNAVADLAPLLSLRGLARLDLRGNRIADLGPLAGLAGLRVLDAGSNAISELRPLSALHALRTLKLDDNAIVRVQALAGLSGLAELELGDNRIADLSGLSALVGLRALKLGGNAIARLDPLSGLPGLAELELGGNSIAHVPPLSSLAGLRRLGLRGNGIADLRPLSALKALGWLDVGANRVGDFSPLDSLEKLSVVGRGDPIARVARSAEGTDEDGTSRRKGFPSSKYLPDDRVSSRLGREAAEVRGTGREGMRAPNETGDGQRGPPDPPVQEPTPDTR